VNDDDRAALRALLQEELRPYSGLPQTVRDLTDEVVKLRTSVGDLVPTVGDHAGAIRALERTLNKVAPQLDRFQAIADHAMPEMIGRLEQLAEKHAVMSSTIDRQERESTRAAGDSR